MEDKNKIIIVGILICILFISGCCSQYAPRDICVKYIDKEVPCIKNLTIEVPFGMDSVRLPLFGKTCPKPNYLFYGTNDTMLKELKIVEVENSTQIIEVCDEYEERMVCVAW